MLAVAASAAVYGLYLVLLGFSRDTTAVYLLTLVSGFGAAGIIAIPITYLQNQIARRAGLGSSLLAVNVFLSGGLSALLFSLGTSVSGYAGTAVLGALAGLAGAALQKAEACGAAHAAPRGASICPRNTCQTVS